MAEKHPHRTLSAVRRYKKRLLSRNSFRSRSSFQSGFKGGLTWIGLAFADGLRFAVSVVIGSTILFWFGMQVFNTWYPGSVEIFVAFVRFVVGVIRLIN